jgi:hypothetical protein
MVSHKVESSSKCAAAAAQNLLHVRSLGICWPNGVGSSRQGNGPVSPKVYDRFRITRKAVNVTRRMIV